MIRKNRLQHIRLYKIPESTGKQDMVPFITDFIHAVLEVPAYLNIKLGTENISGSCTKNKMTTPSRSIIIITNFLDFTVKQTGTEAGINLPNCKNAGSKLKR